MKLTENFTLEEMTKTGTGIPNVPNSVQLVNIRSTAVNMEEVRELLGGHPIQVTSAFRSLEVNKAVGGAVRSAHAQGLAVDFRCSGFGSTTEIFNTIKNSKLTFDQLILEFPDEKSTWVHIAWSPIADKRKCMIASHVKGKVVYKAVK